MAAPVPDHPVAPSRRVLPLAAVVGAITGLAVAGFEWLTVRVLIRVLLDLPWEVAAFLPMVGLALAAVSLRWIGGGVSQATADEYISSVHDAHPLGLRAGAGRMVAALSTLGLGGALGLEGPSIYAGAVTGDQAARRARLTLVARRQLLAAGAAAGVAAIFRTPLTAVVYAIEVPFSDDIGRRLLLPALVGSATGYTVCGVLLGTDPLFHVPGNPTLRLIDLAFAVVLGAACGLGARGYAALLRWAKAASERFPDAARVVVGGLVLAGCAALSVALFDSPLSLGPGYLTIDWLTDPDRGLWLIAALLALRIIASATTLASGGVGGLFIPLVVAGALTGRFVGGLHENLDTTLYTVIGVASFLGAGYQVPLAAVVFVAEISGSPAYVVPGLLAAVVADLVAGTSSVTTYQQSRS